MAGNGSSARQDGVNEQTSLLSAPEGLDGRHLGADTFDNFVSRSLSITRGLGIELESQETALLRGPRRDGSVRKAPRASSRPSTLRRKKPHASSFSGQEDIDEEGGSEVDEPTSPCVADVSVSTFRLIFGGVLTAQFVADFDGTILGSSPPVVTSYFHSSILARALDLVPIEVRGAYRAYLSLVSGAGSALGASTGGAIADSLGWRWEFGAQVPLLAVALCIAYLNVPRKLGRAESPATKSVWAAKGVCDYQASALPTTSIAFVILGLASRY
ncbi:major facilitator superfamily transporter [Marssonina coronariae]|uniref:Major facilitator superfamily transporter n=1 Tax=Diplocarpon coronariae TaxID=2795749 RepID=A0A218ZFD6_9HELO|nr:major facilitator superfamily transporter [Marssonina coronariae]